MCAHCGSKLVSANRKGGVLIYKCAKKIPGANYSGCGRVAIAQHLLDPWVTEQLLHRLDQVVPEEQSSQDGNAMLRLASIGDELKELVNMKLAGEIDRAQLAFGTKMLSEERDRLVNQLAKLRIPKLVGDVRAIWNEQTPSWRNGVAKLLLDRVEVSSAGKSKPAAADRSVIYWQG